jgi:hypothetical protein
MTAPTETPAAASESHAEPLLGEGGGIVPDEAPKGNREARYRVERNEARTALAETQARMTELQTRELHRLAAQHLAAPEDIELSGKALSDFTTPEGWVDHDAVAAAAADLIGTRPGLAKNPKVRATDPSHGLGGGGTGQPNWGDLFNQ